MCTSFFELLTFNVEQWRAQTSSWHLCRFIKDCWMKRFLDFCRQTGNVPVTPSCVTMMSLEVQLDLRPLGPAGTIQEWWTGHLDRCRQVETGGEGGEENGWVDKYPVLGQCSKTKPIKQREKCKSNRQRVRKCLGWWWSPEEEPVCSCFTD